MKKVLTLIIFSSTLFIACKKSNTEIPQNINESHAQKELNKFINSLDEKGDEVSGQLLIYVDGKTASKESIFFKENEFSKILAPIISKLSVDGAIATTSEEEEEYDSNHGSANCKYCSKFGGISCGKDIAELIPVDAEEIQVTISKKDKKGCRSIHVEW